MEILRMPTSVRGVVLDMDNTLYPRSEGMPYLAEGIVREWDFIVGQLGLSVSDAKRAVTEKKTEIERFAGRVTSWTSALVALGVSKQAWDQIRTTCYHPERHIRRNPALHATLAKMPTWLRVLVFTNSPRAIADRVIRTIGIDDIGLQVLGVDEIATFKPDPAAFLEAAQIIGVPLPSLISIGDRRDIDCIVPLEAGYGGAIHVNGPEEVIEFLNQQLAVTA